MHNAPCKSTFLCRECHKPGHNSLIHLDSKNRSSITPSNITQSNANFVPLESNTSHNVNSERYSSSETQSMTNVGATLTSNTKVSNILCTAQFLIENEYGQKIKIKAILDSGSCVNILTAEVANSLGLKKERINSTISGISGGEFLVKNKITTNIFNDSNDFSRTVSFFILPKISDLTPSNEIDISKINFPSEIKLADNTFHIPSKIHALLGCELLKTEKFRSYDNSLLLQNSVFGYLVTGTLKGTDSYFFSGLILEKDNLENSVKDFFKIESFPGDSTCDLDESKTFEKQYCEEHFLSTHKRDETGRYIVKLPIIEGKRSALGDSKEIAERRLNLLWKRLDKNKTMATQYKAFIDEYFQLNHMERILDSVDPKSSEYYIPHHAVFRPESTSTPLRVVFDASANSSNGVSLNSILLNGGTVQQELFSIISRFRTYKYAFSADIQKMYRQILVDESDRDLQRILWKPNQFAPVETYRLRTVTYGTTCAPFLATRALKALAEEEQSEFPQAAATLLTDVYVDDILSGSNNLEETKALQNQLIQLLKKGGMELHKRVSNHPELLYDNKNLDYVFPSDSNSVKTLGMQWRPTSDIFTFQVTVKLKDNFSKREVLSNIARLFDPFGLIGPVITSAKIFLQRLWLQKLNWNDTVPLNDLNDWLKFLKDLPAVSKLEIPRCAIITNPVAIDLHCFCDASDKAYGAVLYLCSKNESGEVQTNILCSKSRVCPIKATTTPRLELSAALLLARLVSKVISIIQVQINHIYMWSDSTITLAWIKTPHEKLKTYVSNRVKTINTLCPNFDWRHVNSADNPADLISRGTSATNLVNNSLWFHVPTFIKLEISLPVDTIELNNNEFLNEVKTSCASVLICNSSNDFISDILNLSNSFTKLCRIVSYIFRFIHNLKNPTERKKGKLNISEIKEASNFMVKQVQLSAFSEEIKGLSKGLDIKESKIKNLAPFLDEDNILRVGGRLQKTRLIQDEKHPKLLPAKHRLTKIIMESFHKRYLHVGPQTLLHLVRQEFWPVGAERVTPSPTFSNCGIDFCGPFLIKYKGQRKGTFQKVYIAVFICFATKAIHLEIVTDLTSNALIATLKRFFARRGKCTCIFSDNAGNFVGTNSELKRLQKLMSNPDDKLTNYLTTESINWKFIPPRSPNFGGLWESGVKSFKYHLKRAVGSVKLTFEEFLTLTAEIEGILNSRPIVPLSTDPHDYTALTPGHFLIGRPITSVAEPQLIEKSDNYLSRWQKITKLLQQVWKNWKRDYLNNLHLRNKWQFAKNNVSPNDMVILKDSDLPPYKWRLGRIQEIIKGSDGYVRVVIVKVSNGIVKRGISQICLLPMN
ncbi:hypothetical protein AVEN_67660-1 [Araneus ventricosus]|uniref:Integrase catalytic domain-containing protein n=1 Tax=Araneus ventricosus TaxID=182803 RepID=A0A4Y2SUA1_ARAVE|nr:hypothetical protein AVEN_67660-1 [Araneus ventricosus]